MAYKVIADFTDLRDDLHEYKIGDIYPYKGIADEARVKQLITPTTQRGALIEKVMPTRKKKKEV